MASLVNYPKYLRNNINITQTKKRKENTIFYEANIILIPKSDTKRKISSQSLP